jgi:hypothetical protein
MHWRQSPIKSNKSMTSIFHTSFRPISHNYVCPYDMYDLLDEQSTDLSSLQMYCGQQT